jgi:hypothetical protein
LPHCPRIRWSSISIASIAGPIGSQESPAARTLATSEATNASGSPGGAARSVYEGARREVVEEGELDIDAEPGEDQKVGLGHRHLRGAPASPLLTLREPGRGAAQS